MKLPWRLLIGRWNANGAQNDEGNVDASTNQRKRRRRLANG